MADNFKILNGDELFSQCRTESSSSDNLLWWYGLGSLGLLLLGVCVWVAFDAGKKTVMPALTGATK